MRGVQRPVPLADGGEQAVEGAHDRDQEGREQEVVLVGQAQGERQAVPGRQRQERVRERDMPEEGDARADVAVEDIGDDDGERRPGGETDQLGWQRRPAPSHEHEPGNRHQTDQDRPEIDAVVVPVAFRAVTADGVSAVLQIPAGRTRAGQTPAPVTRPVGAEHLGQLVDDERDRDPRHQARDHGVGDEACDVAEAQHPEQDLDAARQRDAHRREEKDRHHALGRRVAQGRVAGDAQDERGEQEHRGGARDLVRQQGAGQYERGQITEECAGEGGAQPGLDGPLLADGLEGDEPEGQHDRHQHECGGDPGARLPSEVGESG